MVNNGYIFRLYQFFFEFKQRITELYPELFNGGSGFKSRAEENFASKWSWLPWLDGLTGNDITKLELVLEKKSTRSFIVVVLQD